MPRLRPGRLSERVTLQTPVKTDTGGGSKTTTFEDGDTVWAEVIALRGGEALVAAVQRSTQLYKVTIRMRAGVEPKMRLRWRGVTMNIRSVAPDPDDPRAALVMTAESGVAG